MVKKIPPKLNTLAGCEIVLASREIVVPDSIVVATGTIVVTVGSVALIGEPLLSGSRLNVIVFSGIVTVLPGKVMVLSDIVKALSVLDAVIEALIALLKVTKFPGDLFPAVTVMVTHSVMVIVISPFTGNEAVDALRVLALLLDG